VDTENSVRIESAGLRSVREIIIVSAMTPFFIALLALVASTFRTRAAQQFVALRHQIAVLQQSAPRRLRLRQSDRLLWIWLSRFWPGWRRWLRILKPDTVLRWHRRAFARYWTRKSRRRPGRPSLAAAIRDLIQQMSQANFLSPAARSISMNKSIAVGQKMGQVPYRGVLRKLAPNWVEEASPCHPRDNCSKSPMQFTNG